MIILEEINAQNWEACTELEVTSEQEDFIASNLYSIAQLQFLPNFCGKAIYYQGTLVGFAMYGIDNDDGNYWIYRFMLDKAYQQKGLGSLAMQAVIEDIQRQNKMAIPSIMLGYAPENIAAKRLYLKLGFKVQGMAEWGEELASYTL
ncbi:GNAT family N-acetyltransferase [Pseudomonas sp. F1_0610]|uniref:GNAT family N-acetyltransferase n=1 Tax=Pseudomonas sp. F1_0610 TaxID=3114284 RepID=UPI0039C4270D